MKKMYSVTGTYDKAKVLVQDNGNETLFSYDCPVLTRENGKMIRHFKDTFENGMPWTNTTGRHIKKYCGLTKAAYMNLPYRAYQK